MNIKIYIDGQNEFVLPILHSHGGQIRLPFIGALFTASRYQNKYAQGYIEEKGKKLIVTRGLGESILPIRFNCKPEIVVIEFIE